MSETQHPTPTSSDHAPNEKMATDIEKYERLRRLEAARTGAQFSQEISDSLIRSHDWGTLLSAAPLALGFVGSCQVVASSPVASGLKLKKPAGGFTHLRWGPKSHKRCNGAMLTVEPDMSPSRRTWCSSQTPAARHFWRPRHAWTGWSCTPSIYFRKREP